MRCMVIVKADKVSEAGVMPSHKLLEEMGKFNEELAKAGVLLAGEGLQPSSKGKRVKFSGSNRTVIDGWTRRSSGSGGRLSMAGPRSRFAKYSRRKTSAPNSLLN